MDPLVTGGIHLAREAFKWFSKQEWGSTGQPSGAQKVPTYPNIPVLTFGPHFEIDADESGIYALHPIRLIQSEVEKLKRTYGSIDHLVVVLAECYEIRSGYYLELVPNLEIYFEISLPDLIEGQEQGQKLIFLRDKISMPPKRCTASLIFNNETQEFVGLSYINRNLIYGGQLHILERVSAMANRYYPYKAKSLVNQRACQEYGVPHLHQKYDLTPWNSRHVSHDDDDLMTLRSLYSLDRSDIKHFRSLIKDGSEHIETLKALLGYGQFEEYNEGVLRILFQMCYTPKCNVFGCLERRSWSAQLQRDAAHLFEPISYAHSQSNHHETDHIFFKLDGSNPIYPLSVESIRFTVRYAAWGAPKFTWTIELPEEIFKQLLLDQVIIQVLQILDRFVGVDLSSTDGEFVVKRVLSLVYGEEYIRYSSALLNNYNKVQSQPEVYSERSIVWALMVNTLINPFSHLSGGIIATDKLVILKSMTSDEVVHQQLDFLIAAQLMTDTSTISGHYLRAFEEFIDPEAYEVVYEHDKEVFLFEYRSLLKTSYIGISSREIFIYSKRRELKYTFDMSVDHAMYQEDGDMFKLILNNGKKKTLRIDLLLLSLIRNLICINRNGEPLANSNLNVPNYQKRKWSTFNLLGSLVSNDEVIEGLKVLQREFRDFSNAKALALLIGGGLGSLFSIPPSEMNKLILHVYRVFRGLSTSDKVKVRRMLTVTNCLSNLNDLMREGVKLDNSQNKQVDSL